MCEAGPNNAEPLKKSFYCKFGPCRKHDLLFHCVVQKSPCVLKVLKTTCGKKLPIEQVLPPNPDIGAFCKNQMMYQSQYKN